MNIQSFYKKYSRFGFLTNLPHNTTDLFLTCCGHQICKPNHMFGPARRMEYLFHFILKGKGVFCICDREYHLSSSDIFFIPPGLDHYYCADDIDPWEYIWIGFNGSNAFSYIENLGISIDRPVSTLQVPVDSFLQIIDNLLEVHRNTLPDELDRIGFLFEILSLLAKSYQHSAVFQKPTHPIPPLLIHAIDYIEQNYNWVTVSDISKSLRISRSQLYLLFKKNYNLSPQQYLLQYRLNIARQALLSDGCTIHEIALSIGYSDSLTFSKIFKKYYGISPQNYRKSFR